MGLGRRWVFACKSFISNKGPGYLVDYLVILNGRPVRDFLREERRGEERRGREDGVLGGMGEDGEQWGRKGKSGVGLSFLINLL